MLTPNMIAFSRAATAASELIKLIDRKSKIDPFDDSGEKPQNVAGTIKIEDVTFSYPARPDTTVLSNFSLQIPANKVTALVVSFGTEQYILKTRRIVANRVCRDQAARGRVL